MYIDNSTLEADASRVLDALMSLDAPDMVDRTKTDSENAKNKVFARDFGMDSWDWPQGVGLYGLTKLQGYYGDARFDGYLKDWFEAREKEGLPSRNVNTTAPYIALEEYAVRTKNERYAAVCRERAEWLVNGLPKTREGGFQHVTTGFEGKQSVILNQQQLWVDTLFMAVLFLARAGRDMNEKAWSAEAAKQTLIHIKYLYEKRHGLFYHGWSFERNDNFGGVFWCRGNAWFSYGALEIIEALDGETDAGTLSFIADTFRAQMSAVREVKQKESGLWHTVLYDVGSYLETSGSAAFCAAMFKGVRLGLLKEYYIDAAYAALRGVLARIGSDGLVAGVSTGTGMGMDEEHYRRIPTAPIGYGQSMTALAIIEALLYQKSVK